MAQGLAEYYGNIDLDKRKVYRHPETNKVMTEASRSFGFGTSDDPIEVVLPTVVNGVPVSDKQAIQQYQNTGKHLGQFRRNEWLENNPNLDVDAFYKYVNDYANKIHERQGRKYRD